MTRTNQEVQDRIHSVFKELITLAGYKEDSCYNLDTQEPEVARRLGKVFFDYMVSASYDCGWEGFPTKDLRGISALITDMVVATKNGL